MVTTRERLKVSVPTPLREDRWRFEPRDVAMAGLRAAILAGGLAYAWLQPDADRRSLLLEAFGIYVVYGVGLYTFGAGALRRGKAKAFYLVAGMFDLAFAALVIEITGGSASPLFRALYLWVALLAFLFGLRVGLAGSLLAFAVLLGFDFRGGGMPDEILPVLLQAGGILMHGPLVGHLADRERGRVAALRQARDELAEANRRLVEEQAKLIHAEKLSSIGLLAAGVAHEINNPLTGVIGCVKALREGSVAPERREEYFEAVRDGLERIAGTVRSLLDFARQRPPAPSALDAAELVDGCLRLLLPLERKKDVAVANRIAAGEVRVEADRAQLMQALVNVLVNAIQAVPAGGEIAVSARPDGARVGLRIEDNGVGIPRELLGRVGDPFFTTKPEGEGTGLGLAITQNILRAHGGEVAIESEPGKGTAVTLWLPRAKGEAVADA